MSVDIYDVAREADVSIATVSRVLNNNPVVAPKTREKVLAALNKLNYQPSEVARGLVTKKMQTVGILTVDIRAQQYATTAYTIERILASMGFNTILCNTFNGPEDNIKYVRMLLDKNVSGIICIGSVFDRTFNETNILSECRNIPMVLTNYQVDAPNVCSVLIGEQTGIQLAVDHLISRGHKNILFVKDMDSVSSNKKAAAFRAYLKSAGLPVGKSSVYTTTRSLDGGVAAVDEILKTQTEFSAIIFNDDITAIGGMKRLQKLGYSIPSDVAIIGYNNSVYSECCTPTLTTIDIKSETIGSLAVTMLRELMSEKQNGKAVMVIPELVIRESS